MGVIECFMIEVTKKVEINLRRYASSSTEKASKCPVFGYHNAYFIIGVSETEEPRGTGPDTKYPKTDPRWPTQCQCGYVFAMEDEWQINYDPIYKDEKGNEYLFRMPAQQNNGSQQKPIPPGAMWDADWMNAKGPDGKSLMVMTPGGDWWIDGPSKDNGPGWTRTGTPPKITVRPSILIQNPSGYHAFLTDGRLVPC